MKHTFLILNKSLFLPCLFTALFFLGSTQEVKSQEPLTVYEQLFKLNKYWENHSMDFPVLNEVLIFENDRPLISLHLQLVENHLRNNIPQSLSPEQLEAREKGLDILQIYWQKGVFPLNTHHAKITPYFIDHFNTACAVGHIMRESGAIALTESIAAESNYAYIEEMEYPELIDWAYQSGFTVEELKWIQPGYQNVITSYEVVDADCGSDNGSVDVTASAYYGDIGAYEWRLGTTLGDPVIAVTEDLQEASSGFYSIRYMDADGYSGPGNYMEHVGISDQDGPEFTSTIVHQVCASGFGSITIELDNLEAYQIKWYTPTGELIGQNVNTVEVTGFPTLYIGVPPQYTHRVEVIDANGCATYQAFYVWSDFQVPYSSSSSLQIEPASCTNDGFIHTNIWAEEPVTIEWSNGATTEDIDNLYPGTYTLLITDGLGCTREYSYLVESTCDIEENICWNMMGIDFGYCEETIGIGSINGDCVCISGCNTIGNDGVDYADFIFANMEDCKSACGIPSGNDALIEMELSLKVYLEGATEGPQMNTNLANTNLLNEHPYGAAPYNYEGPNWESIPEYAVDYILIELTTDCGLNLVDQQLAMLLDNGDAVAYNGPPVFMVDPNKTYQLRIRHHNHLDVIVKEEIIPAPFVIRHLEQAQDVVGTHQLKELDSGIYGMISGDINQDGIINVSDINEWKLNNAVLNQYLSTDLNLDGIVSVADYDIWFNNKAKIGAVQIGD